MRMTGQWAFRLIMALFLLLILVLSALLVVAHNPGLNRLLLEQVSERVAGLELQHREGSLAQGLTLDLSYRQPDLTVVAQQLRLALEAGCFLRLELCVDSLAVSDLEVILHTPDTPPEPRQAPVELPENLIPLPVTIHQLRVQQLRVRQDETGLYQARNIELQADALEHRVSLQQLQLQDDYCQWLAQGQIRLTRDYPLTAQVQCQPSRYPLQQLRADMDGSLQQLQAALATEGELQATGELTLQPLTPQLPVRFSAQLQQPFAYQQDSFNLNVASAKVQGEGSLEGLQWSLDSELTSSAFPSPSRVTGNGQVNTQRLQLDSLVVNLPQGRMHNQGELQFSPQLSWQGKARFEQLALAPLEPRLEGVVNGLLTHQGQWLDGALTLNADVNDLHGTLFDTPWQMDGSLGWQQDRLTLQNLRVQQGENRIKANGTVAVAGSSDVSAQVQLPQLEAFAPLLPGVRGSVQGQLHWRGRLQQPQVVAELRGQGMQFQDYRLQTLQLDLDWQPFRQREANRLQLQFTQLQLSEPIELSGELLLNGHAEQHQLTAEITEAQGNRFSIACSGRVPLSHQTIDYQHWQARCDRSEAHVAYLQPEQTWQLLAPMELQMQGAQTLHLEPFCYGMGPSRLCLQQAVTLGPEQSRALEIAGRCLDLGTLQPWLPPDTRLSGLADVDASLLLTPQLQVQADLALDNGRLILFPEREQKLPVSLDSLRISSRYAAGNGDLDWRLRTSTGASEGRLKLTGQQLQGRIAISDFTVAPFSRWLLDEEGDRLEGVIDGRFELAGTLQAPRVEGQAQVRDGAIHTVMLPLPVTDLQLTLETKNRVATMDGSFQVNQQPGQVSGTFNWEQEQWRAQVAFQSENLVYQPEEDIRFTLQPDIQVKLTPEVISLEGEVSVPRARIYLDALPEQAVSVSSDAEVVGMEQETEAGLSISSNLTVRLGEDVRFEGFGLETRLTGDLNLTQQASDFMRAKGIIRLEQGTYDAYGQSLDITDGDLIFIDELENPQLRLEAVSNKITDDVTVGIRVTGRARDPSIELFSNPDMPQQAQLHYLVTGRPPNTENPQDSSAMATQAALALALESNSALTRRAGEKLGIQDLTLTAGSTEDRSEVGLSGYITPDLMIRYGLGMFEAVNTLTLKYRLYKNLYAEVISGRANAVDLLWSFSRD